MAIVTLSLNPTIDVTSETDLVQPTHKIRTSNEEYEPGGGGVNVARVIIELGGEATLICPAGGFPGDMLDELLGAIPVRRRIVPIAGNTRITFTVFERKPGKSTASRRTARSSPPPRSRPASTLSVWNPSIISSRAAAFPSARRATFWRRSRKSWSRKVQNSFSIRPAPASASRFERGNVHLVKPSLTELEALAGRRLDHDGAREAATDLVAPRARRDRRRDDGGGRGARGDQGTRCCASDPPRSRRARRSAPATLSSAR